MASGAWTIAGAAAKRGSELLSTDPDRTSAARGRQTTTPGAPLALERMDELRALVGLCEPVLFLDYDGTLTPIVDRPDLAVLDERMRSTLGRLARLCAVCIISGRKRSDVARLVGLDNLTYAGAHGFDIAGPHGTAIRHEEGEHYVPALAAAADELRRRLASVPGVIVEDKIYAVAVHFRLVKPEQVDLVEAAVDDVLSRSRMLRRTGGKKIFELRPDIDWDKGRAVLWLLDRLGLDRPDALPIYLGDDITDRDAFVALKGKGISVLVSDEPEWEGADYRLKDPDQVRRFLDELADMIEMRPR